MGKNEERGRAYRRYQRRRIIRHKKNVSRKAYFMDWFTVDGKYDKGHIGCGCGLCKPGKRFGRPSWKDNRKTKRCLDDIKGYWISK